MKILELRKQCNKKQAEVANALGIKRSTFASYETGTTEPTVSQLILIADYFNVSLDYLCDRPFNNNIGYVPDDKKEGIKMLLTLNQENYIKTIGFMCGISQK